MSSHTCPMRTCGWRTSQVLSHKKTSCSVEASLFYLKHFSWKYAKRHCRLNLTHIWAVWPKPWPLCTSHSYQENQTVGPDYVQSFPNSCLIIRIKCLQVGNKDLEIKNCTFISSPRIINEDFFYNKISSFIPAKQIMRQMLHWPHHTWSKLCCFSEGTFAD